MSDAFIPAAKPLIGQEERAAVDAVLQSGMLAQGSEVSDFETEFGAALAPGYHTVATNAGTTALLVGLLAAGIGPGGEVIVPSFTFAWIPPRFRPPSRHAPKPSCRCISMATPQI